VPKPKGKALSKKRQIEEITAEGDKENEGQLEVNLNDLAAGLY